MRVAVLGGGFAGLTAAYYLSKKGHSVSVFEKDEVLGGLAVGFKRPNWEWSMEKAIHHLFTNDHDILNFAHDLGFDEITFRAPTTASLYADPKKKGRNNYRKIPVDTPQDFLLFPLLPFHVKIRAAFVLAFLKLSPYLKLYERYTAEEFLRKTMGDQAWEVLWKQLFRKKFGKYAGNILASFIWARIKKRTKKLGYIKGGFQAFLKHIEKELVINGVVIKKSHLIRNIVRSSRRFQISYLEIQKNQEKSGEFDAIVSTLPTPILVNLTKELFPSDYQKKLSSIQYNHAISLVVEMKKPFLDKVYWANVCVEDNPIMGVFEHTNFMDPKHYGGKHLLYVGNYVDATDPRLKMNLEELIKYYFPHLKKINPGFKLQGAKFSVFKGPFAQPIFDKEFLKNKPEFTTPVKNFYIANLDMTYPYDRGTNYAVALGKKVADLLQL